MGDGNCTRVSNPLPRSTSAGATVKPSYIFRREKPLDTGGGMHPFGEERCNQTTQPSTSTTQYRLTELSVNIGKNSYHWEAKEQSLLDLPTE